MSRIRWSGRYPLDGVPAVYAASGPGWSAQVFRAAGSGWEAKLALEDAYAMRWPEYHEGITGKTAEQCRRWVRRMLARENLA